MVGRLKRIVVQVLGWAFLVLGIAGIFLPILQGILFLMIGLYLLSREYHWAQRWMQKLQDRYPQVVRQARYWQVRLGLSTPQPGEPEPLRTAQRVLALVLVVLFVVLLTLATRAGASHSARYWSDLQRRYEVVEVTERDNAQVVELRRKWALRDRRYVVRCHLCEPVEVGHWYRFEALPDRNPPMLKRLAGPGEIPDFYTVVEGQVRPGQKR